MPLACALSIGRSFFFGGAGASLRTGGGGGLNSGRGLTGIVSGVIDTGVGVAGTPGGSSLSLVDVGVDTADVGVEGTMLGFLPPILICGLEPLGAILILGVGRGGKGGADSMTGVGGKCIVTLGTGSSRPRTARSASLSMHHRTS